MEGYEHVEECERHIHRKCENTTEYRQNTASRWTGTPPESRCTDKLAHDFRLLFLCNPIPQADHKGGTAIIIPFDSIELKGGETFHDAVDRIRGTLLKREHGRIVAAHAIFEDKPYRLVSVYAPPDSAAATRPDYFKHALGPQLTGCAVCACIRKTVCAAQLTHSVSAPRRSPMRR